MKITILNGSSDPARAGFETYLSSLAAALRGQGNQVELFTLREMKLNYCSGCFGCWNKTPGECVSADDGPRVCRSAIHADFLLWAAPLRMGYPDACLKKMMDKSIPLIHPYFAVVNGESHHRARYEHYPLCGLLVEAESDSDPGDLRIVSDLFRRTALNMKSALAFAHTTAVPAEEVARAILSGYREWKALPAIPGATRPGQIQPPARLTLFNGSPRGAKGNTPILLEQFAAGFRAARAVDPEATPLLHLNRLSEREAHLRAFESAECVWLGFPLYTDAMPGIVKAFIDDLEGFKGRVGNPPIGFLVQSGFPEGAQSRFVERYLEKLAGRLGSPYLGTIVRGGGEGTRLMPDNMNRKLFDGLRGLGADLAANGCLDIKRLRQVVGVERYSPLLIPLFKILSRTSLLNFYWDSDLKKNNAYERRFARPYA